MSNEQRQKQTAGSGRSPGKISTAFTGAIVLVLTMSAVFFGGGMRGNNVLRIAVPDSAYYDEALGHIDPLSEMISRVTGRDVEVVRAGSDWPLDCELYIMPASAFRVHRKSHDLEAVYACGPSPHRDAAVLIVSAARPHPDLSTLTANDFIFASPRSPNGCWQQLRALDAEGVRLPETFSELNFARGLGDARVVFSVLFGRYTVGACRASDLLALTKSERIGKGEVTIIRRLPALPETILAARSADRGYFEKHFERLRTAVIDPSATQGDEALIELLVSSGVRGFAPVAPAEIAAIDSLAIFVENRFGSPMD